MLSTFYQFYLFSFRLRQQRKIGYNIVHSFFCTKSDHYVTDIDCYKSIHCGPSDFLQLIFISFNSTKIWLRCKKCFGCWVHNQRPLDHIKWKFIAERFAQHSLMNVRLTDPEFLHFRYVLPVVEADVTSWIFTNAGEPTPWRDGWIWIQNLKS